MEKQKIYDLIEELKRDNKKEEIKVLFYTLKYSNFNLSKMVELKYKDLIFLLKQ